MAFSQPSDSNEAEHRLPRFNPVADDLQELISTAERELVLVAPFVKALVLERLLDQVPGRVTVTCITRWRPEEVAVGVSDLEVFDIIVGRANSTLLLWPRLHAKYFRADSRCLVGSANLTSRALGWAYPPNIELLIEVPAVHPTLVAFEQHSKFEAQPATLDIREFMKIAAAELSVWQCKPEESIAAPWRCDAEVATGEDLSNLEKATWLPLLRYPSDLYLVYTGYEDKLSEASRAAALRDLAVLDPPIGLPQDAFYSVIAALLLQLPLLAAIDDYVAEPRRFGAMRDFVASKTGQSRLQASSTWQTTMRWLIEFLPDRYYLKVPAHSEVFGRVIAS